MPVWKKRRTFHFRSSLPASERTAHNGSRAACASQNFWLSSSTSGPAFRLERLAWEFQLKALKKAWDALGIHLEAVPCTEGAHDTWVGLGDAPERNELGEELLKAG